MIFQDFARLIFPDKIANRTVYDLDNLVKGEGLQEGESSNSRSSSGKYSSPTKSSNEKVRSPSKGMIKRQSTSWWVWNFAQKVKIMQMFLLVVDYNDNVGD